MRVVGSVIAQLDCSNVKSEFGSDLLGPLCDEINLVSFGLSEGPVLIGKGEVLVRVKLAVCTFGDFTYSFDAKIIEEWHQLVHLPGVVVIWKWEGCVCDADLLENGSSEP